MPKVDTDYDEAHWLQTNVEEVRLIFDNVEDDLFSEKILTALDNAQGQAMINRETVFVVIEVRP